MINAPLFSFLFLLALLTSSFAQTKEWRNADASKSFQAAFVAHDQKRVTLRKKDGELIRFPIKTLHPEDQKYILNRAPSTPGKGHAFARLWFGDSREKIKAKLLASKTVSTELDATYRGRTGFNGIYRTNSKPGGLHCYLFFDWDENDCMDELTLRTEPQDRDVYGSLLFENWKEMKRLLVQIHGNPTHSSPYPKIATLQNGQILNSHEWKTKEGNSVLLGTAQNGSSYLVTVRMTSGLKPK